jgi:hypothetical protein
MSHRHTNADHEHEFEPQLGLPELLPENETILWQGSPDWKSLARYAFHINKLVIYFAVIIAIRVFVVLTDGLGTTAALASVMWLGLLAAGAIGVLAMIAYFSARTSLYTITNKRLVMRVGIVLTITYNLPFKRIASAGLRNLSNNKGDIPVVLMPGDKIAYTHLWPHVRPWRFAKPEPMLRSIHDPKHVAEILSKAWSAVVSKDKEVSVSGTVSGTAAGSASNLVRKTSHNDLSAA